MYPILFRIGNFPINTYGVFLALAFLGAIFVTVKLAERDGLPIERIYDLCLWLFLSSLVFSAGRVVFLPVAAGESLRTCPGACASLSWATKSPAFRLE